MSTPYRRPNRPPASKPAAQECATLSTCPACGKASHPSRKAAKRFARAHHPAGGLSAYACPFDGGLGWHLGHLPGPVVHGQTTRDRIRTRPR